MSITAAEIESNGWVLRLTVTGSLTSPNTNFGAYTLSPSSAPRVNLAAVHPGFIKSGGQAVAGSITRNLVATRPLRLPVNPASPTVKVLDETDLGGGSIRIRLALSEHFYATDTGLSLSVLAGWRTGAPAQSGIAVINNSTVVAPIPIMRWALAPYDVTTGTFRVTLLVMSHHPVGFEPAAGVKFTVTDGTTVKTFWVTELGTDNTYGDNLRAYTTLIDPATATALTAGLLRIDAEVYPWLGNMRTTDPAGTRSMTTLRTDGYSVDAASPWVIAYDPAGTRYGQMWAFLDPVNGTTTASAAMIATTLAGAKAVAPASRPRDVSTAVQAAYLTNRTLPAANGQASQTRSIDGLNVVVPAGAPAVPGGTAVTTGIATAEVAVRIIGDPDDANPRANCILRTSTAGTIRVTRITYRNLTVEVGAATLFGAATIYHRYDNAEWRGRAGLESNTVASNAVQPPAGQWNICATGSKLWRFGTNFSSGVNGIGLFRANEHSRHISSGHLIVKNRLIGNVEDGFVGTGMTTTLYTAKVGATLAGEAEDRIVAWNDLRFLRGRAVDWGTLPAATAGTPSSSIRRNVFFNNVCERIGTSGLPFYSLGEDALVTMSYNIIEANTFAGERSNTLYSDPLPTTIAETNTQLNYAFVNRVANNVFDWLPCKHDDVNDAATQGLRGTNGYRPQMIEAWSALFGVGFAGNYDTARTTGSNFELMFPGLRSVQNLLGATVSPQYTADGSVAGPGGPGATGGGNYRPLPASPLLGRALAGNSDRDLANMVRSSGTAGALEPETLPVALTPAAARSGQLAYGSALAISLVAAPLASRHLHFADPSACAWQTLLPAATAASVTRDAGATVSAAGPDGGELAPAAARHALPGGAVIILPDSGGAAADTLSVTIDLRTLSIR